MVLFGLLRRDRGLKCMIFQGQTQCLFTLGISIPLRTRILLQQQSDRREILTAVKHIGLTMASGMSTYCHLCACDSVVAQNRSLWLLILRL